MKQAILLCDFCYDPSKPLHMPVAVERVQVRTMMNGTRTFDACADCFKSRFLALFAEVPEHVNGHGKPTRPDGPPLTERVVDLMGKSPKGEVWVPDHIAQELSVSPQQARAVLLALHKAGTIERVARGQYSLKKASR